MEIVTITVTSPLGLHARPASLLTKLSRDFKSDMVVYKNGDSSRKFNVKNVLSVMEVNAALGDKLTFEACGVDEQEAIRAIEGFANSGFGEWEIKV